MTEPLHATVVRVETHLENQDKRAKRLEERVDDIHEALVGSGDGPGLKGRVDRLEQAHKRREKHIWGLWTAAGTIAATLIARLLKT